MVKSLECIQEYQDYILEKARFKDDYVNDDVFKYRFPNNYGIMLALHEKDTQAKYSVDFIVYDSKDSDQETYISLDQYNTDFNSYEIKEDAVLEKIFKQVFDLPIHIKVTADVKQAIKAVSKLNSDEIAFIIDYFSRKKN